MGTELAELAMLLKLVETLASLRTEGRLTLLRYAGGWRVGLGHGAVEQEPIYPTLVEALKALLIDQVQIEVP